MKITPVTDICSKGDFVKKRVLTHPLNVSDRECIRYIGYIAVGICPKTKIPFKSIYKLIAVFSKAFRIALVQHTVLKTLKHRYMASITNASFKVFCEYLKSGITNIESQEFTIKCLNIVFTIIIPSFLIIRIIIIPPVLIVISVRNTELINYIFLSQNCP